MNDAEIGVTAKDCVVSLTSEVDSYAKKMEAEDTARIPVFRAYTLKFISDLNQMKAFEG